MSNPNRVKPVDYFEHIVIAASDTHLYRIAGTSYERAAKTDLSTWDTISTFDNVATGFSADANFLLLDTGTILVIGEVSSQKKIFRSVDGGANWSLVSNVDAGSLGGNRGWCVARGVVYFGEYDPTGANPTIKLYKIENDGATISTLNTWTGANGVTDAGTIKHIHCVNYEAGYVYIGTGDGGPTENQCGMIRWDLDVGDWSNVGDIGPTAINSVEGFIGRGDSQKYRATDIVAFNGKLYNFSDASAEFVGDRGIWQCDLDLTNFVNLNNEVNDYTEYSGYYTVALSNQVLFVPYINGGGVNNEIFIWGKTASSGVSKIATFRCKSTTDQKNISAFFVDDDKVYMCATNAAGDNKNTKSTTVLEITSEEFRGPLPDVVHPVYWANSTGSASNNASDPRNAKLTLNDCLSSSSSDQVSQAACVMVEDASYSEAGFVYGNWNTTVNAAENVYTQVRGSGKTSTVINFVSGTNAMSQGSYNTKLLLSDLTLDHNGSSSGSIWAGSAATTGEFTTQDCVIGLAGSDYKRNITVKDSLVKLYRTLLNTGSGTVPNNVNMSDNDGGAYTNYDLEAYSCIFNGAHRSIFHYYGSTVKAYNCAFVNYQLAGVATQSTSTVLPVTIGCVFVGLLDTSANTPYDDDAGQTWSGANNDYNMMDRTSSTDGVPNTEYGENSTLFMNSDQLRLRTAGNFFADPLNLDFTPTTAQRLMYKMPQRYTEFGYDGVAFTSEPSIGVYGDFVASGGSVPRAVTYISSQTAAATSSAFTLQPGQSVEIFSAPRLGDDEFILAEVLGSDGTYNSLGILIDQRFTSSVLRNKKTYPRSFRLSKTVTQSPVRVESN
jgi:hypothetical protein